MSESAKVKLHRIREVREAEGMTLRSVARRVNGKVRHLRKQEEASTDLRVSDLYQWGQALGVPVAELLAEPEEGSNEAIRQRACLLRIGKTAKSLLEKSDDPEFTRLVERLLKDLIGVMPEIEHVTAWPEHGQPRTSKELGKAAMIMWMATSEQSAEAKRAYSAVLDFETDINRNSR